QTDQVLAQEPEIKPEDPEALKALSRPIPGALDLEGARAYYRATYGFKPSALRSKSQWRTYQGQMRNRLRETLGIEKSNPTPASLSRDRAEINGVQFQKLLLRTEPSVDVPALMFFPESSAKRHPAVVIVHPRGKRALLDERHRFFSELLGRGFIVLALDIR